MMDNFDKIVEYNKKKSEVGGGEIKKTPKFYMYSAVSWVIIIDV